jgi:hypothetical protein
VAFGARVEGRFEDERVQGKTNQKMESSPKDKQPAVCLFFAVFMRFDGARLGGPSKRVLQMS